MLSFVSRFPQRSFVKYFAPTHEYIDVEGSKGKIGLSHFATHLIGDVTFVNIETGKTANKKDEIGTVEAAKAVSPVLSPVSCTVDEINQAVVDDPSIVGKDPEGKGWVASVTLTNQDELNDLMSAEKYAEFCKKH